LFDFTQRGAGENPAPFFKMKACLSFDLDDPQDAYNHMMASNAINMAIAMWSLDRWLEQQNKRQFKLVRQRLREELENEGLIWDNLHR
jgi:hypothetical protein